jgi:predicted RNA methylase
MYTARCESRTEAFAQARGGVGAALGTASGVLAVTKARKDTTVMAVSQASVDRASQRLRWVTDLRGVHSAERQTALTLHIATRQALP